MVEENKIIKTKKMKGIKKDEKKKIVIWEGFRKELPWLLFWALFGVMVYGYYQDKQVCDEVLADPCDACYKLNQTLMDSDYLFNPESIILEDPKIIILNLTLGDLDIPLEDKNPNDRTLTWNE